MAGVWERLVRSTKTILRRLLENETKKLLTDEGLYTLLCEVEFVLNDRPISTNPSGLDDAPALTPNMLLTFQRRTLPALNNYDPRESTLNDGGVTSNTLHRYFGEDLRLNTFPLSSHEISGDDLSLKSRAATSC